MLWTNTALFPTFSDENLSSLLDWKSIQPQTNAGAASMKPDLEQLDGNTK